MTDGRLNARVKCDLTENLTLKVNAQVHGFTGPSFVLLMFSLVYSTNELFPSLPMSRITPKGCLTLITRSVFLTVLLRSTLITCYRAWQALFVLTLNLLL